jgi:hypothetical protein
MKIIVFLHGTAIMHKNAVGQTRLERVRQVLNGEESVIDFSSYVPVEDVVPKLLNWKSQGAEIVYLSSHRKTEDVEQDRAVLKRHGFPVGPVLYRRASQNYADVAEQALPDILIEDDCESIGGAKHMTYPHIRPELQAKMRSVVVREFGGIGHLPDDIPDLLK